MLAEEHKSKLRRFFEEINNKNIDAVDQFIGEDFVNHSLLTGSTPDHEGLKNTFTILFQAFPYLTKTTGVETTGVASWILSKKENTESQAHLIRLKIRLI